jgi:hypoxanthine-DNA glycosylase
MVVHPLEPVADKNSKILILGSMPGKMSLQMLQYYAHPQNRFWRVLYTLFNRDFSEDYGDRMKLVKDCRIALWDTIYSCERPGSLDKDIKNETPNDIPALLKSYPNIRHIICNGQKSYTVFNKYFSKIVGLRPLVLPSTSPVPRKTIRNLSDLLLHWEVLLKLL